MKIVLTAKGTDWDAQIDPRFGRTEYICIYDEEKDELSSIDNRAIENEAHGAGPITAQKVFDIKPDVVITGNGPGGNAEHILRKMDMKMFVGAGGMNLKEAYEAYKKDELKSF